MKNEIYFTYGPHKKNYTLEDFNSDEQLSTTDEQAKKRMGKQIDFYKKEDAFVKSHT